MRLPLLSLQAVLFLCAAASAAGSDPQRVLLLYGSQKDLPMNLLIDSRLRSNFREKLSDGVELYSEYVDVSRFPDKGYPRKLLEHLKDKYSPRGLDLIVVVESVALDQLQLHRDWFFPDTPIVFCCVTEAECKARTIRPGVTGIPAKLDYRPTLEAALRFHPGTKRVVMISGASRSDNETMEDAIRNFRPLAGQVEFNYLIGLPMADLRHEVARLSADTIIIYVSIDRDGAGKFFIPRDALDQVAQTASVPIYGYYDSYLGHGIVGGFLASFDIEATNAAHLGLRILAGAKPQEMSTAESTSCAYMFDWRELRRWGINEESLPPGSIVRFRDPSFWDLYRWHVIGVLTLCVVEGALVLGQRARARRTERERTRAEERFRLVVESTPNAIVVVSADGNIVLVNSQCEAGFGYRREELVGQPVEILMPERYRAEHPGFRASFFASPLARPMGAGRELYGRRKDGSEFPVEIRLTPIQTDAGLLVMASVIDLTERKRTEKSLQASERRYRTLFEKANDAIFLETEDDVIIAVNQRACDLLGYSHEELLAMKVPDLQAPEVRGGLGTVIKGELAKHQDNPFEGLDFHRDGRRIPVEVTDAIIEENGKRLVLSIVRDISERKRAEEARRDLAHASRLAIVGELTASIAHEINQPLGAILSNADAAEMLLESTPAALDEVRQILHDIRKDDLRASEVILRLRALLRKRELEMQALDLNAVTSEVLTLVRAEALRRGVVMETDLAVNLPAVRGDKVHLQQVLLNLVLNGMEAMADIPEAKRLAVRTLVNENGCVEIAVTDAGSGIPPDRLRSLFDPFFSTKKEGMGLGLSIARSLVDAHGGRIWAENNFGVGATFHFTVPTGMQKPGKAPADMENVPQELTA